jgi:hypothetical protein
MRLEHMLESAKEGAIALFNESKKIKVPTWIMDKLNPLIKDPWKCPFCEHPLAEDAEHCEGCGACLPPSTVSDDGSWCEFCGVWDGEHDAACVKQMQPSRGEELRQALERIKRRI